MIEIFAYQNTISSTSVRPLPDAYSINTIHTQADVQIKTSLYDRTQSIPDPYPILSISLDRYPIVHDHYLSIPDRYSSVPDHYPTLHKRADLEYVRSKKGKDQAVSQ